MEQIIFRPKLYKFDTLKAFTDEFKVGGSDLILTNKYIYDPYSDNNKCGAQVIYQEEFGGGEPTDTMVDAIISEASKKHFERVIAIGGGTVIDIAKVLSVSDGGSVDSLYDHKDSITKLHQLIIIPTTCGTGSEVTNISIINRTRLGVKMGLTSENMFADYAVLVPELLAKLPLKVFGASSIDALVHAVESSLSPKATVYTKLMGYKAIEMIITGYQKLVSEGMDKLPQYMGDFLTASNMAGFAFGTAGLRGSPCAELPPRRYISRSARREQLRAVHRSAVQVHGEKAGRRNSTSQRVPCRASALRREECLQRA